MEKLKVGVIGGTGMVGQRYVTLIAITRVRAGCYRGERAQRGQDL